MDMQRESSHVEVLSERADRILDELGRWREWKRIPHFRSGLGDVGREDKNTGAEPRTREGDKDKGAQGRAASEIELSVEKAMWLDCSRGDPEAAADLELVGFWPRLTFQASFGEPST